MNIDLLSDLINKVLNREIDFVENKNANFGTLEIDSLDMFDIISEIENQLNIELNNEEFLNISCFNDLYLLINNKVAYKKLKEYEVLI